MALSATCPMNPATARATRFLIVSARYLFKLRHKPLEIAGWEGEQEPIAGLI
jgi:hypothetical protein